MNGWSIWGGRGYRGNKWVGNWQNNIKFYNINDITLCYPFLKPNVLLEGIFSQYD
jgi:hypothetical protein